jgi:ABC-2 type transport system ATP-binding protein
MKITLDSLVKRFGEKTAVDIEHFEINNGDMLGLVGNNGAGKTTLFRLLLDLHKADEGSVTMLSADSTETINPAESEEWKDYTGAFIDDGFLIDYLTSEEYFEFIAKISGIDKPTLDERLKSFERFMGGEIIGQKKLIRNLSAGNKQKVGIISAMMREPELLILDEPFNFLDPTSQSIIKHMLREYNKEHGATVLVSSHNLNHTVDICPRIALLENGKIIRDIDNRDGSAEKELEQYFNVEEE